MRYKYDVTSFYFVLLGCIIPHIFTSNFINCNSVNNMAPFSSRVVFILFFLSILLAYGTFAAKETPAERTEKFLSLAKRDHGTIDLDSSLFDSLIATPRNYGVSVLLTALGSDINCQPCREFDPEYRVVASSFFKTANKDKVFFAVLDFKNGRETFQKLQLTSAPTLYYYPPADSSGSSKYLKYEFNRQGFKAEELANKMSEWTGYHVPVTRPFNYVGLFTGVVVFLMLAATIRVFYSYFMMVVGNKYSWAAASLIFIVLMNAGFMWNHIRKPPYVIHQNGQLSYITHGFQQQLGLESQIVAIIYGILAFSTMSLALSVPRLPNAGKQRIAVYVWIGCVLVVFSFLMQLFKIKNGGYPFRLLF